MVSTRPGTSVPVCLPPSLGTDRTSGRKYRVGLVRNGDFGFTVRQDRWRLALFGRRTDVIVKAVVEVAVSDTALKKKNLNSNTPMFRQQYAFRKQTLFVLSKGLHWG